MAGLAWREDMRQISMASQAKNVLALATGHLVSRNMNLVGWARRR